MATFYVRTTGDDTTGDGSTGAPWQTISGALGKATFVNGSTLLIGDGTYSEDSGSGYLFLNSAKTDLTFASENGVAANVIIQGSTHATYSTIMQRALRYAFNDLTFQARVAGNWCFYPSPSIGDINTVTFTRCTFHGLDDGASQSYAYYFKVDTAGKDLQTVTFTNCTFDELNGVYGANFMGFYGTGKDGVCDGITLSNCTVRGGLAGIRFNGGTNWLIDGGTVMAGAPGIVAYAILVGNDGDATGGYSASGTIQNLTASLDPAVSAGHVVLIGANGGTILLDGVTSLSAYDYAIAVKSNTGTTVQNCRAIGGSQTAYALKGTINAILRNNVGIAGAGGVFYMVVNGSGQKVSGCQFVDNYCIAMNNKPMFSCGGAAHDDGTNIVDRNRYRVSKAGWGEVYGTALATRSLVELQAVWAGYAIPTNDQNSVIVRPPQDRRRP